jgi:hypothetical protein
MQCSVHNGKIKGRVHWWNHRAMCGRCYGYFTKRVRVVRAPPHASQSTLLDRLRRWLS